VIKNKETDRFAMFLFSYGLTIRPFEKGGEIYLTTTDQR
jgi:hypothetical protein